MKIVANCADQMYLCMKPANSVNIRHLSKSSIYIAMNGIDDDENS